MTVTNAEGASLQIDPAGEITGDVGVWHAIRSADPVSYTHLVDRYEGFLAGVGETYLDVVATQTANWETDQGYTAVQNILTANRCV